MQKALGHYRTALKLNSQTKKLILSNNEETILKVDEILKGRFSMTELSGLRSLEETRSAQPITTPTMVEDILDSYNGRILDVLRNLIVEYSPDIRSSYQVFSEFIQSCGVDRNVVAKCYFDYLKTKTHACKPQAADIEKTKKTEYHDFLIELIGGLLA